MNAETSVYIAAGFVAAMVLIVLAIAAMVLADMAAGWTPKPRPRHASVKSPGAQYWVRSTQADTAAMPVAGWSR